MIVNSNELLKNAKKNKVAIPHFNINNLEWTKYILEECNKENSPVILGVSEGALKYMGGPKIVATLIRTLDIELNIKVPVVIHLDHGKTFEMCKDAIDNGFTSVMIDASEKSLEENINLTKKIVDYAEKYTVSVEAELGSMSQNMYTKLEEAKLFVEETGVDSLAPALGTVHGIYREKPNINFDLCGKLSRSIDIPLVLHGASGLDDITLKRLVNLGICKVNINTEIQIVWSNALKNYLIENGDVYDPRKIISSGEEEMKKLIRKKINILCSN